jgi:hypothetical protein
VIEYLFEYRGGIDRAKPALEPQAARATVLKQLGGAVGASSVADQGAFEAFGEDLARAIRRIAEPATAVHTHPHCFAAPRQINRPIHSIEIISAAPLAFVVTAVRLPLFPLIADDRPSATLHDRRQARDDEVLASH